MTTFNCSKCNREITNQELTEGTIENDGNILKCPDCGCTQSIPKEQIDQADEVKSSQGILNKIYQCCQNQQELLSLVAVLDAKASFLAGLTGENWFLARYKVAESFQEGRISQEMRDRILACIPEIEPDEAQGPGQ
jgi:hypothetical protein